MKTSAAAFLIALAACVLLVACNQKNDGYRVIERLDAYVDRQGHPVSDNWYEGMAYDHEQVRFVLQHGGHKIYALCDVSTVDKMDTNASCALRPLREYACTLGRDDILKAPMPLSDLTCKDADGRKVYLYVNKEESISEPENLLGKLTLSDWAAIANLVVAVSAFLIAIVALAVARKTLIDAEEDWKQRKWFDLYAKADEAHTMLVSYRKIYPASTQDESVQARNAWNQLMFLFLQAHTMAGVFPKNPAIDELFEATSSFTDAKCAYEDARLEKLGDAVEGLRQRALLKKEVL